jgi:hypothetical protein
MFAHEPRSDIRSQQSEERFGARFKLRFARLHPPNLAQELVGALGERLESVTQKHGRYD